MSHAMDITEERVINAARRVDGAEERLRTLIGCILKWCSAKRTGKSR